MENDFAFRARNDSSHPILIETKSGVLTVAETFFSSLEISVSLGAW